LEAGLTASLRCWAASQKYTFLLFIEIELQMQDDGTNHCQYILAADLSIDYYYLFCALSGLTLTVQGDDLLVDVNQRAHIVGHVWGTWL